MLAQRVQTREKKSWCSPLGDSHSLFGQAFRQRWAWLRAVVPNLFGIRDWFCGRQFFHGSGGAGQGGGAVVGFQMVQVHYSRKLEEA